VERDIPRPGEGQVVVKLRAWSLNYRDLMVIAGTYNPKMRLPATPLSDAAGEVLEIGPGVTRVNVGDRVMAAFMQKWIDGELTEEGARSALGAGGEAVGAQYVVLDQEGLIQLPEFLSYEEAASLPCAGVTAWHALVSEGHLRPGETVLTLGTGGVSIFALQFAKLMGARVIATSSKPDKIERLKAMGADQTINYMEQPDWHKIARGVDHVIEVGGKDTLPKSLRAVRPNGTVSVIGVLSGRGELDYTPVFMRNIRLQGIFVGSRTMAEDMLRAMAAHELRPVVDRVFELGEARDALRYMESGAHFGKIVLRIS
jgi:NADPH:quinone reductase-like Zn-dependent oxidoreductase